uniref:Uncharacterized protein n=1 Tax=Glossina austeni TaxID=7395 RepID=A0A1A9V0J0_GLOAU
MIISIKEDGQLLILTMMIRNLVMFSNVDQFYCVGYILRAKQSQLLMAPGLMSPFMTPLTNEIFRPMTCQYLEMNRQHVFIKNRNYLEVLGKEKKAKTLEIAQMPVE